MHCIVYISHFIHSTCVCWNGEREKDRGCYVMEGGEVMAKFVSTSNEPVDAPALPSKHPRTSVPVPLLDSPALSFFAVHIIPTRSILPTPLL